MIKNDFRYIIKKIIIGIGIFIGIFYFKSCNVSALESEYYSTYFYNERSFGPNDQGYFHTVGQKYKFVIDGNEYNIEYKTCGSQGSIGLYINDFQVDCSTISHKNEWIIGKWPNSNKVTLYYAKPTGGVQPHTMFYSPTVTTYPDNFPVTVNNIFSVYDSGATTRVRVNFVDGQYDSNTVSNQGNVATNIDGVNYYGLILNGWDFIVFGTSAKYSLFKSGSSNQKWISSDFTSPTYVYNIPRYVSLGATPILSDDDTILLGYNFQPTYTFFDSDNYKYCYKVGDSPKLCYTDNDYSFQVRGNLSIYFTIESLSGNVLDSETFTIFDIGNSYTGDYSIDFDYKDIAPSDTDNSTGLSNIIDRVDIYMTYFPKSNKLKYQYQFVNSGGSLDPHNWSQVNNDNSVNEYTYTTHDNGTLYARILDDTDNIVATNTFTVDTIGKLKLYDDNNNVRGIFDSIKNNINYSGPIYSLILMPINFINNIYSNASNTCQRYKIGTLLNNDIYFECVDFSDYIGSDLYNLIDILSASGVIYGISLFIKRKYNQFTSLSDNDNDIM